MATSVGAYRPRGGEAPVFSYGRLSLVARSDLGNHATRWDQLVDTQPIPNYCLKSWWIEGAVRDEPFFLLAFDGEELVGGLALELDRWHRVNRARTVGIALWPVHPVHFDIVAAPSRVEEVCHLFRGWFRSRPPLVFDLRAVSSEARILDILPGGMRVKASHGSYAFQRPTGGMTEWLQGLTANRRKDVRRALKRLDAAGCRLRTVPSGEAERALRDLHALQEIQFGADSLLIPEFERIRQALEAPLKSGEAQFFEIVGPDGRTLVIDLWVRVGWRAVSVAYARSPEAPSGAGHALLAFVVDAVDNTVDELDLGTHEAGWKEGWTTLHRGCVNVYGAFGARPRLVTRTVDLAIKLRRFASPKN